jgi:hypothetical protein
MRLYIQARKARMDQFGDAGDERVGGLCSMISGHGPLPGCRCGRGFGHKYLNPVGVLVQIYWRVFGGHSGGAEFIAAEKNPALAIMPAVFVIAGASSCRDIA